ncbi:MAG: rod-binding protein [Desulfovibrionaceae bacterium]
MIKAGMDPQLANSQAQNQELVRYKQRMDSLRQRLDGQPDKEGQLKKACKDFEAVFIGKLWEQMRRTVPKDEKGMHSKQEDMYLSMFDRAFSEHMADAGGIGLSDLIYDQLASQLKSTSNATLPGNAEIKPLARNGKPDIKSLKDAQPEIRPLRGPEPEAPRDLEVDAEADMIWASGDLPEESPSPPQAESKPAAAAVKSSSNEPQSRSAATPPDALAWLDQADLNARFDALAREIRQHKDKADSGRILAESR